MYWERLASLSLSFPSLGFRYSASFTGTISFWTVAVCLFAASDPEDDFFSVSRSEIHAFSIEEGCFQVINDDTGIHLLTLSGFLAKNQLHSAPATRIFVPVLAHRRGVEYGSTSYHLCPVRALQRYLQFTRSLCGNRRLLFISYSLDKTTNISPSTISRWRIWMIKMA